MAKTPLARTLRPIYLDWGSEACISPNTEVLDTAFDAANRQFTVLLAVPDGEDPPRVQATRESRGTSRRSAVA